MSGNSSLHSSNVKTKDVDVRVGTLILMQCLIIPGNVAVLLAIWTFTTRTVSDILIGCLAFVDLLNGIVPVNITISMYYTRPSGFVGRPSLKWLCLLYTWTSCVFRLTACFIATLMAVDRFIAIVSPFRYRSKVTVRATCWTVIFLFIFSVVIGILSISGIVEVHVFSPMCSFDFASSFAAFIVVLGYSQLIIVIICYLSVIIGIKSFLSRQTFLKATQLRASFASKSKQSSRRDQTGPDISQSTRLQKLSPQGTRSSNSRQPLVFSKVVDVRPFETELFTADQLRANRSQSLYPSIPTRGSLARIIMTTTVKRSKSLTPNPTIKLSTEICHIFSDDKILTDEDDENLDALKQIEIENEAKIQSKLRDFKKNHSTWRQSRRLAIVMGIVVFLFYLSWMPIVIIITMGLTSKSTSNELHFAAARMSLVSSMLNVFVYGIMLKQYRQAYKSFFLRLCVSREHSTRMRPIHCNAAKTFENERFKPSNETKAHKNGKQVRFKRAWNNAVSPALNANQHK